MNRREKLINDHPLPWSVNDYKVFDIKQALVADLATDDVDWMKQEIVVEVLVGAVNRLYGPILCPKCDKPSGQRDRLWLCQDCRDAHIKDLQSDIHLYQSAEHRASREADFNKDT